jgi:TetR/AcrR family transcriptional regulator, transcriptional repressor for nem operon
MRAASKRFPEKGFEDVTIADLMKEVGLTVGGFCKYFDSREDLAVESLIYVLCGGPR